MGDSTPRLVVSRQPVHSPVAVSVTGLLFAVVKWGVGWLFRDLRIIRGE